MSVPAPTSVGAETPATDDPAAPSVPRAGSPHAGEHVPPDRSPRASVGRGGSGFAALQSRNFRLLWIGMLVSNAGTWMAATAEGWLVTDLTPERAAFSLGLIAISFAIPMLVLPPFGGAIADRMPRLRLLWTVQVLYLVFSLAIAALTLSGVVNVWFLMANSFLTGVVLAFDSPVRHALLPDMVTRDQLPSAVSLNSAAFTGAALVGPAIAGALIPLIGVGGVFVVNSVSYLAVLWALTRFDGIPAFSRRHPSPDGVFGSIRRGMRYVRQSPLLSGLLLVSTISGLFARSYGPLLAVFARDVYHLGSVAFGFLVAAPGLGTLAGALGLAGRGNVERKGRWVIAATLTLSALLIAMSLSTWYVLALPLLALVGLCSAVASALTSTLIQLKVPGELRGRVMSLYVLTLVGVPSAGALIAGTVADALGVRLAVGGGAALVLVLVSLVLAGNRELREAP